MNADLLPPDDAPVSLDEQIKCVRREIAMRRSAYPRFIATGRLKQGEAEHEQKAMAAVLRSLESLAAGANQKGT